MQLPIQFLFRDFQTLSREEDLRTPALLLCRTIYLMRHYTFCFNTFHAILMPPHILYNVWWHLLFHHHIILPNFSTNVLAHI